MSASDPLGDPMVNLNGKEVSSVSEILEAFRESPSSFPCTYRVRYRFGMGSHDPYAGASMERPAVLSMNEPGAYPWEAILVAAANCAGSDYPMLAEHFGVPLDGVDIELSAVFDPRGEFEGLGTIPQHKAGDRNCYQSLHWKATLVSSAPREALARVHERALSHNMVLNALRAVPLTGELVVKAPMARRA